MTAIDERAFESLRRHVEALDAITAHLPALVAYMDPEGRYVHANATYREWMGVDPETMMGRTMRDVLGTAVGSDYWARVRLGFEKALGGSAAVVEAEGQFADRHRHVEARYTPDLDSAGRVRGVVALVVDITDRKAGERELLHRARLLDQALEPVLTWRPGGPITYWNGAAERLYGYTREEAIGQISHELLQTQRPIAAAEFERELAETGAWAGELRHIAKDGRAVTVDSIHRVVESGAGPLVIESNRDITEKRATEEALRAVEDRLRRAILASGVGVWEAELPDGVLTLTESTEDLFGLRTGEARRWDDLRSRIWEPDRQRVDERFRQVAETGSSFDCEFRVEAGGTRRWVRLQARASRDASGRVARISGAALDVTEHHEARAELVGMAESLERRVVERTRELQEANRELESFSYSVSHDLRAPLRSIEGFGELLLRDYQSRPLDEAGSDYLRRMNRAAVRMGQLIDDLLALSRLGRTPLHRRRVDLSAMAAEVIETLRSSAPGRAANVAVQEGLSTQADPGLARVLLENLLSNAWKFTAKTEAKIEVGEWLASGERAFFVRDNGAGFDMRHAAHLFAPFQRLHRAAEFEGTGLGLATVQRIVHRHGGRIWAEAAPGKGATFYFTLGDSDGQAHSAG